jgi:hypothetical protein
MKDALLKLKFDMLYRGLSREEAAKRYEQIITSAETSVTNKSSNE